MKITDKENYKKISNSITMKNLKKIIDVKGFSITKVSVNSKVGESTLFAYINGQRIPSLPTLINLADYLKCNIDYLLDRTDNPLNINDISNLDSETAQLINNYLSLPTEEKKLIEGYMTRLLETVNK